MFRSMIVSPWQATAEGNAPLLAEMLAPGDSCMDATGSQDVIQEPNVNTWEVWCSAETLAAIAADERFAVLWSEVMDE